MWTLAGSTGYAGPVHLSVASSTTSTVGTVAPPSQVLQAGQTVTFNVIFLLPLNWRCERRSDGTGGRYAEQRHLMIALRCQSSCELLCRSPRQAGSFSGTLTGGNGRFGSPGETLTYGFYLPPGLRDISLGVSIPDNSYNLEGVLVTPDGSRSTCKARPRQSTHSASRLLSPTPCSFSIALHRQADGGLCC